MPAGFRQPLVLDPVAQGNQRPPDGNHLRVGGDHQSAATQEMSLMQQHVPDADAPHAQDGGRIDRLLNGLKPVPDAKDYAVGKAVFLQQFFGL